MSIPDEFAKQVARFPECLRKLVEAELADGNSIVEISGSFPAAPCGDCVRLARPANPSRRKSGEGLDFYDRNSSLHAGEFTDAKRHFFVTEPPRPPEPPPDMDAIRADLEAKQWAADVKRFGAGKSEETKALERTRKIDPEKGPEPWTLPLPTAFAMPTSAVERFRESMKGSFDQWHDGTGYDLTLLKSANAEELAAIESLLLSRGVDDWRDVEALAAIDSERTRERLRDALKEGNHQVALAVAEYAPELVPDAERTKALVAALEGSEIYGGVTQALLDVEEFHPPKIIAALFRSVLARSGENAVHFAAMLMFVHGKAESSFDWDHRPLFLRFHTEDRAERESAFRELCEKIGVDPEKHLRVAEGSRKRRAASKSE